MVMPEWLEAVGYMGLKWPTQQLDEPIARAWFTGVARFTQPDVMAALDRLSWKMTFRPALADVVAETSLLLKERPLAVLAPYIPQTKRYGVAWHAVGIAAQEGRLPVAELNALVEKHKLWFDRNGGQETKATTEMVAEVEALAAKVSV